MASSKRNLIPLVLAVILALVAVVLVKRVLGDKEQQLAQEYVSVVVTTRALAEGSLIVEGDLGLKSIPRSAMPPNAILSDKASFLVNQKTRVALPMGAYIEMSDIQVGTGLSEYLGEGEWAVSISLDGGAITSRLRPGDEIALIGTFSVQEEVPSKDGTGMEKKSRKITAVVMPKVRILALSGNNKQGGDAFVLALPPQQAQMLLAAQSYGIELAPALRRQHDESNLNRTTTDLIDADSFNELAKGLKRFTLPEVPTSN